MLNNSNSRLKSKIKYTILVLVIYILGKNIPLPLIETESELGLELGYSLLNNRQSILALDLAPWMSASIIVQLTGLASGRQGGRTSTISMQRKTRLLALLFAVLSAAMLSVTLVSTPQLLRNLLLERTAIAVILVAGVFSVIWLSEQNKEKGIGGMVIFIFMNIFFNVVNIAMSAVSTLLEGTDDVKSTGGLYLAVLVIGIAGMLIMYWREHKEIRFPVQRVMIDSTMERQNYFAIKANPAGAQALMYVMAFYMMPYYLLMILRTVYPENEVISSLSENLSLYRPIGVTIYLILYILVSIGLSYAQINPADIQEQMQKKGDCMKGVRPGKETKMRISRALLRSACVSAVFFSVILGASLALRIVFPVLQDMAMLPLYLMILTGIAQMIVAEVKTIYSLDHYGELLSLKD